MQMSNLYCFLTKLQDISEWIIEQKSPWLDHSNEQIYLAFTVFKWQNIHSLWGINLPALP